jgi:hypothetical protein
VTHPPVYAVALTPAERDLLARALRAYRTEQLRTKANCLHMLERALDDRDRAWLGMSTAVDTPVELEEAQA